MGDGIREGHEKEFPHEDDFQSKTLGSFGLFWIMCKFLRKSKI
jgi:hypothetical protein